MPFQIVDRQTIARHLLSDQNDPFNRDPLSLDKVIPQEQLKEVMIVPRLICTWVTLKCTFPSKRLRETRTGSQREPGGGIHETSQREICTAEYLEDGSGNLGTF